MIQLEDSTTVLKKRLKVGLLGEPGAGKTALALDFPRPLICVDTESGTDFFRTRVAPFRVLKTKNVAEVIELVKAVESGTLACETLVIDSLTMVYDVLRESGMMTAENRARRKNEDPEDATVTPRDWNKIKMKFNSLMTRLYDLPAHVVVTGWLKTLYEGEGNNLKKVGTTADFDKRGLHMPDILLELAVVKGKHVAYIRKDRTGHFAVDSRLTDLSYAQTFEPLVAEISQGTESTRKYQTEEEAAESAQKLFDSPGLTLLRDTCEGMGLTEAESLWLLSAKLKTPISHWGQIPANKLNGLVDGLISTDAASIVAFVRQNRQVAQ